MIALWLVACGGDKDAPTTMSTPTPTAPTCTRQPCVTDLASATFESPLGAGGAVGATLTVTESGVFAGAPYGIDYGIDAQVLGLSVPDLTLTARWLGYGYDLAGIALGAADTDGDGAPEVVIGRPGFELDNTGGRVQLVDPTAGNCQLDEPGCALLTITGAAAYGSPGTMRIGWGFAFAADDRELWFTGSREGAGVGALYAYESATRGVVSDADARRTIAYSGDGSFGAIEAWDGTGDGIDDLVVQDPLGVLWWEGPWRSGTSDDADGRWGSPCDLELEDCDLGQVIDEVGDVTGDGRPDLAIAAPQLAAGAGAAYLDDGVDPGLPPSGAVDRLPMQILGVSPSEGMGFALTGGDFDGDGAQDLAVSASGVWGWGLPGVVVVFRGPIAPGVYTAATADGEVYGARAEDSFARALASLDVDGDGADDLVAGAPGAEGAGAVYIVPGPSLFP